MLTATINRIFVTAFSLAAAIIFLNGCSAARIFHKCTVHFIVAQDSTKVRLSSNNNYISSYRVHNLYPENYVTKMARKGIYDSLDNRTDSYIVMQSKKGYLPMFTPVVKTRFNGAKIIDVGLPIAYLGFFFSLPSDQQDGPISYPVYYMATIGLYVMWIGPWTTYQRNNFLPPLEKINYRGIIENRLYVKDISYDTIKGSLRAFSSLENVKLNHSKPAPRYTDPITYSGIDRNVILDSLNHLMHKWGYLDTTNLFSKLYSGANIVRCRVTDVRTIYMRGFTCIGIKCKWQLYNAEGNSKIFETVVADTSTWISGSDNQSLITDGLVRGLNKFLGNDSLVKLLQQNSSAPVKADTVWKPILIAVNAADNINTLNDATQAVVTIKLNDRYFSGCIISSDGYLVTTGHVSDGADAGDSVKVLLSNGDSITAHYVRGNSLYDFALYKLTRQGHYKCFSPDTLKSIGMGTEVYAIGTPEQISLHQSLTKGIISGKRKIKGKIILQTDASLNRGSSGGALVDKNGRLLGIINSRIVGIDVQGIGFAIPGYYINDALKVYAK